jgi:tyrosine-protein phosphatase YwqE
MNAKFKVLKTLNGSGHLVNDSEGIPMEWDTYEQAKVVADLFQSNTVHGYTYIVVHPNGNLDVFENK